MEYIKTFMTKKSSYKHYMFAHYVSYKHLYLYLYHSVKLKLFLFFVDFLKLWHVSFWVLTILHIIIIVKLFFLFIFYPIILGTPISLSLSPKTLCIYFSLTLIYLNPYASNGQTLPPPPTKQIYSYAYDFCSNVRI